MTKKYIPLLSVVMLTILLILSVTAIASNQNLRRKNLSLQESLDAAIQREETHVCPVIVVEESTRPDVETPVSPKKSTYPSVKTTSVEVQTDGLTRLGAVTVSHYDVCVECCGKTDGIGASGRKVVPYSSVAVDPAVIPLGSRVVLDFGNGEVLECRADDTGGGITGNKIDLCVDSHSTALNLGLRKATVYYGSWEELK